MITKTTFPLVLMGLIFLNLISCQEPNGTHYPNSEAPKQIISMKRAQEMYDSYSKRRVPIIRDFEDSLSTEPAKFDPTRYVEYDLNTIKQYIAFVEKESRNAKVDVQTLRFYLANYPDSSTFTNGDPVKYPKRTSMMIVPTAEIDGETVGFYIEEAGDVSTAIPIYKYNRDSRNEKGGKEVETPGSLNEAGLFTLNTLSAQEPISLILNDGNCAPPPPIKDFEDN